MNAHVMELLEEAKKLSVDERIELADLLYADIAPDPEWEAAWAAEAERRLAAIDRGEMALIDSEEVHARLRAKYDIK